MTCASSVSRNYFLVQDMIRFNNIYMKIVLVIFTIVFSTSSFADGGLRFLEKNLEIINNEKSKGCEEN